MKSLNFWRIFFLVIIGIEIQEVKLTESKYRETSYNSHHKCMLCRLDRGYCCPLGCEVCSFDTQRNCWCHDSHSDSLKKEHPLNITLDPSEEFRPLTKLEEILKQVSLIPKKRAVVAGAHDENVIKAAHEAKTLGIADSILVGDKDKIIQISKDLGIEPNEYEIIDEKDLKKTGLVAVKLIHEGKADLLMKGLIDSKNFLKAVLNKDFGLRTGKPLSHVCAVEVEGVNRLLFMSDGAFILEPTLKDKEAMTEYAVQIANACGVSNPKVALLSSTSFVNAKFSDTIDDEMLTEMSQEGLIKGCIVDGPISFDQAISPEAAHCVGGEHRKIIGDADIFIFPEIHSANIVVKSIVKLNKAKFGCVVTGVKSPVVLTSRGDSDETKLHSIALSAILSEKLKNKI